MSSDRRQSAILVASMTTVATIVALGFVTPIALATLPLHIGLAAGTIVGVGGVAAILFKMTGVVPRMGQSDARTVSLSMLGGVSLSFFGSGFMALEQHFLPFWAEHFEQHVATMEMIVRADDPSMIPVVLVSVALLPALFEEILFRGLLTRYLGAHLSKVGVVLVVGVLFGILHVSPIVLLPLAYVGGLWTILAQRTGGWGASAASHFAMNATSAVVLVRFAEGHDPSVFESLVTVALSSTVATLTILAVKQQDRGALAGELDT